MSFEVTVTPTVYDVEVSVNPSVQPFDVEVITQQDLADLVDEAKQYAEDAEDSADSASASASSASASALASANSASSASASASSASSSANTATTQAGIATSQAGIATTQAGIATTKAQEASQSASDALASEQASAQSASDALASEQASAQSASDALASELASAQSEANALASEQSALSSANTATVQAGIATTQAGNALTSANNALNSANAAAASAASAAQVGTSTLLTGFATGANSTILSTDTILGAFQKAQGQINARVSGTGASGQVGFWTGTGTQSGDSKFTFNSSTGLLQLDGDFEFVGAQTLRTSSGVLTLATNGGNGSIFITPNGTGQVIIGNNDTNTQYALLGATVGRRLVFENFINNSRNNAGHRINASDSSGAISLATVGTDRIFIQSNGNIGINTITDAGFRLDVNGTARVQGALSVTTGADVTPLTISGYSLTGSNAQSALSITGTWNTTGTPTLIFANVTNTLSNGASLLMDLQLSGTSIFKITRGGLIESRTILFSGGASSTTTVIDVNRSFVPTSGSDPFTIFTYRATINQTGGANGITRGLYVNPTLTSAADWRSIEWSNNTGRGLWGAGTADNAIAGALNVGSASNANASAILELTSTTRGLLLPRMTSAQRDAIASPVAGLVVYNTTDNKISWYNGTAWANL